MERRHLAGNGYYDEDQNEFEMIEWHDMTQADADAYEATKRGRNLSA